MELWIRSQDKKCLIRTTIIKWENGCLRGATDEDGWYQDLGKYKKERALEVLDEIQNKFKIICTDSTGGEYILVKNLIPIFYEMPKE